MNIRHLFISPGHNYFGHYGQPPGTHPILAADAIECVAGQGIRGDRFFGYKPDYKGQITFFQWEVLCAVWGELGIPADQRDTAATRRNVLTEGIELPALIGREFGINGIRFYGTEECRPCSWMDGALRPGAEESLRGRGGLRARILTSGTLKIGPCDVCS